MKDFMKLVMALSAYNDGRYDGCRIGRACLERTGEICTVESVVKKERGTYLVLEVVGYDRKKEVSGRLTVTMLKGSERQSESAFFSNQKGQTREISVGGDGLPDEVSLTGKQDGEIPVDGSSRSEEFFFTQEQIDDYLERVHDTNPIHCGQNAIVPGLMLVDFLLDRGLLFPEDQKQEFRFRKPLPVGSIFLGVCTNQGIWITSPDRKICYVTVSYAGSADSEPDIGEKDI